MQAPFIDDIFTEHQIMILQVNLFQKLSFGIKASSLKECSIFVKYAMIWRLAKSLNQSKLKSFARKYNNDKIHLKTHNESMYIKETYY